MADQGLRYHNIAGKQTFEGMSQRAIGLSLFEVLRQGRLGLGIPRVQLEYSGHQSTDLSFAATLVAARRYSIPFTVYDAWANRHAIAHGPIIAPTLWYVRTGGNS